MHRLTADEACVLASRHARAGDLDEAEKILDMAIRAAPKHARSVHDLGLLKFRQGRIEEALELLRRAVTLAPGEALYHSNLGVAFQRLDRLYEAEAAYRRALELKPEAAAGHFNLGLALQKQERNGEAASAYRRAVELDPGYGDAWNNLGAVLQIEKAFTEAEAAYRRSLALTPDDAEALNNLGCVLEALDRKEEGEAAFRHALELQPDYPKALNNLASLLRHGGRMEEAEAVCRQALTLAPDYLEAYHNLALAHSFQPDDPLLHDLEQLLAAQPEGAQARIALQAALGKALDELGHYQEAFAHYHQANKAFAKKVSFDPVTQHEEIAEIKAAYPEPLLSEALAGDVTGIFIVGMSRSGKTLTESLLAQHPRVVAAGERREWSHAIDRALESHGLGEISVAAAAALSPAQLRALGETYLEALSRQLPGGQIYVNTMPGHYRHLGLIFHALPSVKVIYCRREPLDHCLRVFFSFYAHGNAYAYDQKNLAAYLKSYQAMMAHWRALYGPRILTVDYETLVRKPQETTRSLYAHCGLDFDPVRLNADFKTDQIGHAQHYADQLQPLRMALGL